MTGPVRILVLGASYGLLPGAKLSLAGHKVTLIGRADEIKGMASAPLQVAIPARRGEGEMLLSPVTDTVARPGGIALRTPDAVDPADFDFIILAMQEPQFAAPELAPLMARVAASRRPCLSIMNLAPPPFLARLGIDAARDLAGVFQSSAIWAAFDPRHFSLASPDPQAFRPDPARPGHLQVSLPSNFKAAPFGDAADQALLQRLASDMSHLNVDHAGRRVRPPIALLAAPSLFVPLAKWPMLLTGNCRAVLPDGVRSIAEAVGADLQESHAIYEQVTALALALGARPQDMVSFAAYARAAERLTRPSSLARALDAGAVQIERVDLMVQRLMQARGHDTRLIDPVIAQIEARLATNRGTLLRLKG